MPRPPKEAFGLPWAGDDDCPCGSGRVYNQCCLQPDGLPLVRVPSLVPPGPKTEVSNPGCYLAASANCSDKLSREHYVSEAVLAEMQNKEFVVGGLPWIPQGETRTYAANALASRILCDRHNSALSPLDVFGAMAMKQITAAFVHAAKKSLSRRTGFYLISGDGLELWSVKTLMGLHHAKITGAEGQALAKEYTYDEAAVLKALTVGALPEPLGLNSLPATSIVDSRPRFNFAPLFSDSLKLVGGMRMATWGLHFDTLIDATDVNPAFFRSKYYRPWLIDLTGQHRTSRIVLTWTGNRREANRVELAVNERR